MDKATKAAIAISGINAHEVLPAEIRILQRYYNWYINKLIDRRTDRRISNLKETPQ